jgi:DNA invertase Pin-like site-specific DNA recombinase
MTEYIYSRVSTDKQSTDAQLHEITSKFPGALVISETASGAKKRPMLMALLGQLKSGDTLIVYSLDRLGRSTSDVLNMLETLNQNGINFISNREGVDFRTPVGKLVLSILAAVAEMEREMIRERVKSGLAAARDQGRLIGRKKSIKDTVLEQGISLVRSGQSIRQAAEAIGMSSASLGRAVKKQLEIPNNLS